MPEFNPDDMSRFANFSIFTTTYKTVSDHPITLTRLAPAMPSPRNQRGRKEGVYLRRPNDQQRQNNDLNRNGTQAPPQHRTRRPGQALPDPAPLARRRLHHRLEPVPGLLLAVAARAGGAALGRRGDHGFAGSARLDDAWLAKGVKGVVGAWLA